MRMTPLDSFPGVGLFSSKDERRNLEVAEESRQDVPAAY